MADDDDLRRRNPITAASVAGVIVEVDGNEETRPWHTITSVGATIVKHGPGNIFVLAMEFDDARVFVIGEVEPAWSQLVEIIHTCLPGVEPFTSWAPRLLEKPGAVSLFERGAQLRSG